MPRVYKTLERTENPNEFVTDGEVSYIFLINGMSIIVDTADLSELLKYRWCGSKNKNNFYPFTTTGLRKKKMKLSHFLMRPPDGMIVDHIDGNTADNRRQNLRVCTYAQNVQNTRRRGSSGFKGVRPNGKGWAAFIHYEKKYYHLGTFSNPEDAAKIYDEYAIKFFGEFACTNKGMGLL